MKLIAGPHINRSSANLERMALGHPSEVWGGKSNRQADGDVTPCRRVERRNARAAGWVFRRAVVAQWCERFGPKRVVLGGAALIAAGFALLGVAREVWQFCILYGLLGVTAGMTGTVPLATSFSNGCEQPRAGDGRGFK